MRRDVQSGADSRLPQDGVEIGGDRSLAVRAADQHGGNVVLGIVQPGEQRADPVEPGSYPVRLE
jgi:hypothetical protein